MRYAPPGLCVNDFTVIEQQTDTGTRYHLLHLQASPVDPFDASMQETSYGHAISTDLVEWTATGPAFGIGIPGSFDDGAVWTMCCVEDDTLGLLMFYTGVRANGASLQAIGVAAPVDKELSGWKRVQQTPICEADGRWYRTDQHMAWRDPFVIFDEVTRTWVMLIAARDATQPPSRGGCVARAISHDLRTWIVGPPVIPAGQWSEIECPVLLRTDSGWLLVFCVGDTHHLEILAGDSPIGPFRSLGPLGPAGPYAPRFIRHDGVNLMIHTQQRRQRLSNSGHYVRGVISQPKVLKGPADRPSLAWWPELDRRFGESTDAAIADGLTRVAVPAGARSFRVELHDVRGVLVGAIVLEPRTIAVVSGDGDVVAGTERTESSAVELKILRIGEFLELYLDDTLTMSTVLYPQVPVTYAARADETAIACVTSPTVAADIGYVGFGG